MPIMAPHSERVRDLPQASARVSRQSMQTFELAQVLFELRSTQELLRPVLEDYAAQLRRDYPQIAEMAKIIDEPSRSQPKSPPTLRQQKALKPEH